MGLTISFLLILAFLVVAVVTMVFAIKDRNGLYLFVSTVLAVFCAYLLVHVTIALWRWYP